MSSFSSAVEHSENVILFDWFTFTSHSDSVSSLIELLGLNSPNVTWESMPHGRNGYRQRIMFQNISILFDGAENMGCCVDMSGSGCRAFESYSSVSWDTLLSIILSDSDYHITRLDMAFDDHTGILDIAVLQDDTDDHHYVSRSRVWQVVYGSEGTTIYHGSQRSNMFIRIYDKAAQLDLENQHWIRIEMQMRDEIATGFANGLLEHSVGSQFRGVLHNYLRYVKPVSDVNMSRWPLTDYWSALLEDVERITVWSAPGVDYSVWNLRNLVINQVGNAVDTYIHIFGINDLIQELGSRSVRLSPKYLRLREDYDNIHTLLGLNPLSDGELREKEKHGKN